ncbi:hypothetical protein ABT390_12620 [Streptomyces aurantiacus]|uniref:Uncharacterized protein n=1 Tax=Streptomyces aurantiacus JA 4570 TaxID=1286094 RepID=S3ZML0_9ACTN|nr:hypothetical protein [Streptomyces aurantiacus]EPH44766.1 hypothetical protein STRAU_2177 [Streptomyces aurantiacus JA 4570]
MSATTHRGTRLRRAVTGLGVTGAFAGLVLSGAPSAAAAPAAQDEASTRSASAAPLGFHGTSASSKARISGTYQYWRAGTGGGRALYDGKFSGATAQDRVAGDGYEAVLALKYDEFVGGGWRTVKNRVAVVNGTKSWGFKNKANVTAYACDRKVGTSRLLNCRAWKF